MTEANGEGLNRSPSVTNEVHEEANQIHSYLSKLADFVKAKTGGDEEKREELLSITLLVAHLDIESSGARLNLKQIVGALGLTIPPNLLDSHMWELVGSEKNPGIFDKKGSRPVTFGLREEWGFKAHMK